MGSQSDGWDSVPPIPSRRHGLCCWSGEAFCWACRGGAFDPFALRAVGAGRAGLEAKLEREKARPEFGDSLARAAPELFAVRRGARLVP